MNDKTNYKFVEKIKTSITDLNPDPEFKEKLWQKIVTNQKENPINTLMERRLQPIFLLILLVVIVAFITIGVGKENIALAFSKLQGYLPGIGFVERDGEILYLEKPIQIEERGITFIINKVWADEKNVIINYEFSGLSDQTTCTYINNKLLLPDGRNYLPISGGSVSGSYGTQKQLYFQPLPKDVRNFYIVVGNDKERFSVCDGPEEWQIEVTLKPLPDDDLLEKVYQAEELQITPLNTIETSETILENNIRFDPTTVNFSIDRIAIMDESYVVSGHYNFANPDPKNLSINMDPDYLNIKVTDADKRPIEIKESVHDTAEDNTFVFKFDKHNYKGPVLIEFQSAIISVRYLDGEVFTFEAGEYPEVGQTWQIDRQINLVGYEFIVENVTAIHDDSISQNVNEVSGYAINLKNVDSNILSITITNKTDRVRTNEMINNITSASNGKWVMRYLYPNYLPVNNVTYQITDFSFRIDHNWAFEMELP